MPKRKNKNSKGKLPGKPVLFLFLAAVCAMAIVNGLRSFFLRSSYFTITRVSIEGVEPDAFLEFKKRLVGKNIFSQDLKALKKQIEESADIECIVISRRLPGKLVFNLRKRIPLAQLKLTRYHLLDPAGVLIAGASDTAYDNLPVILGIEKKNLQGKPQAYYPQAPELTLALELIKEKNNAPALAGYRLTKVHVLNQKASSFFIVENFPDSGLLKKNTSLLQIEIKFDLKRPVETMRVLGALLDKLSARGKPQASLGLQAVLSVLEGIEYIDLMNIDSPVVMEKKKNKQ